MFTSLSKNRTDCREFLLECGIEADRADFFALSEASQIQVTDETILKMMKFITEKYNSLDFSEIEKSAGDITKFKYYKVLRENRDTLENIYAKSDDPGAKNYAEVSAAIAKVFEHLEANRMAYSDLYKSGNGVIQLLYISLVAGCIYSIGILITHTIRFVTTETNTECQVLFSEIPGTLKHVHIKNIMATAADIPSFEKVLKTASAPKARAAIRESIAIAAVAGAIAGIMFGIPLIISLVREIIYSVYFTRVKLADMLALQMDLINTNIESLEAGRGSAKVIARQKKWVDRLRWWQKRLAVNVDSVNSMVSSAKNRENANLKIDRNSPIGKDPSYYSSGDLML